MSLFFYCKGANHHPVLTLLWPALFTPEGCTLYKTNCSPEPNIVIPARLWNLQGCGTSFIICVSGSSFFFSMRIRIQFFFLCGSGSICFSQCGTGPNWFLIGDSDPAIVKTVMRLFKLAVDDPRQYRQKTKKIAQKLTFMKLVKIFKNLNKITIITKSLHFLFFSSFFPSWIRICIQTGYTALDSSQCC